MKRLILSSFFIGCLSSTQLFAQNTYPWPATGSIGIGTTSPGATLQINVAAPGTAVTTPAFRILDADGTARTNIFAGGGQHWALNTGTAEAGSLMVSTPEGFPGIMTFTSGGANRFNIANRGAFFAMGYHDNNSTLFSIRNNGRVGIGMTNPDGKLAVLENANSTNPVLTVRNQNAGNVASTRIHLFNNTGATLDTHGASIWLSSSTHSAPNQFSFWNYENGPIKFGTNSIERVRIDANGNVGIGTTNISDNTYKLYVEGSIRTRKVRVDQSTWADHVFHPSYQLPSLQEVEAYIKKHQHLPDVPSAVEVQNNGLDLGDNQAVLLQKIEELMLYTIEQNKVQEKQVQMIEKLNKKLEYLQQEIERLKQPTNK